jgi:hypothetical protein
VYDGVIGRWDGRVGGQLAKSRSRKEWLIAVRARAVLLFGHLEA